MALDRRAQAAPPPPDPQQQRPVLRFPAIRPPSRGAWTFFSFFLFALALIGGAVAAVYQPGLALTFQQLVADLWAKLPETIMVERVWQVAGGAAGILLLTLIWQAGRFRRPLFYPILLLLCAVSATVGLHRGGRDLARFRALETEMTALQQKLDKSTGSLQQSSLVIQEREAALSALKKELEELKQKLAEKP